jgi:hypothetical protein
VAAALVLGVNTALRPIVHAINRQPIESTEEEQNYLVSIDCRAARASDIRSMLVQEFATVGKDIAVRIPSPPRGGK